MWVERRVCFSITLQKKNWVSLFSVENSLKDSMYSVLPRNSYKWSRVGFCRRKRDCGVHNILGINVTMCFYKVAIHSLFSMWYERILFFINEQLQKRHSYFSKLNFCLFTYSTFNLIDRYIICRKVFSKSLHSPGIWHTVGYF